jgi:hypothetical protein
MPAKHWITHTDAGQLLKAAARMAAAEDWTDDHELLTLMPDVEGNFIADSEPFLGASTTTVGEPDGEPDRRQIVFLDSRAMPGWRPARRRR